jgi:large subunit ribosomal protein L4
MAQVLPVLSRSGEKKGEITLNVALFGVEPNEQVMHQAVQAYLANQRVTTAMKKTRAEVSGGGRKPWKQKHTGRARSGSTRVPQWRHGGLSFAPKPRDVSQKIPKKVKRLALRSALSVKAADDQIRIVEDFELPEVSTKEMASLLAALGVGGAKTLLVYKDADEKVRLSARNIANLRLARPEELTTYELLHADLIVMTRSALARVEEVFGA